MNKASIFLASGWVGLAGIAAALISSFEVVPMAAGNAGVLTAVAACWVMLFTRNADEFTRGLWTAAASMAFATLLIMFLMIPFLEGVYDGFNKAHSGAGEPTQDIPAIVTISCAIGAFYIGLFWKRARGGI